MRPILVVLTAVLVCWGVGDVKLTDACIKMGNVCATVEADAHNQYNETAEVAIKAYFYDDATLDKPSYIADNTAGVILKPGEKTEVKVPILYAQGAFTLGKVEIYLNGQLAQTLNDE
jgi:hypothetical protein